MNLEITNEEKELLQKLIYNESLKQDYLVKTEQIKSVSSELVSLVEKLQDDKE